jgi:threonine dehydrogenase-like Zn-dependent dehydrogenase
MKARAAVLVSDETIEIRELPVPDAPPEGGLLLAVEGCGMCGSDIKQYHGGTAKAGLSSYPVIPGHETVGRVAKISAEGARTWHLKEGDRVAVHGIAPCGVCPDCMKGARCQDAFYYGFRSIAPGGSGLYGGFGQMMEIMPRTKLYPIAERLKIEDALLFNPVAAGYDWMIAHGGLQVGETVLILGSGQRGLACVVAAAEAGASQIIVTSIRRDAFKLDIARKLGATATLIVEDSNVPEAVLALTGGYGVDLVCDTTPYVFEPVRDAIKAVRVGGRIVLSGLKDFKPMDGFPLDVVTHKQIRMIGVLASGHWATTQAIRVVESGRFPLELLHTHSLPIDRLEHAIHLLAGEIPGEQALHISILADA